MNSQVRALLGSVITGQQAIARCLPDLVGFLMATGLRIGEACGLSWNAVDLEAGTIEVRAAAVRVRGHGLVVKSTKTDAGARTLVLPRWCTRCCATEPTTPMRWAPIAHIGRCSPPRWGLARSLQHPGRPARRLRRRRLRLAAPSPGDRGRAP
ncbi:tyrosine-type recombinase/integrase [Geodermatophilus amargosae]|uniref:tyrosine-type recombinase/integrase n=1 Tax=Geodermatophilus amargosae TaxID=1296565 RepID=UPI002481AACD|nr:tyrosine-type recombinase/integrase [Geodermatophilus amargosae]